MQTAIITATAPTAYQVQSLSAFGMGYKANGNGSYSASMSFETIDAAKEYLRSRADMYNYESADGSEISLLEMYEDINNGYLTLDAVTAFVNTINE